MVYIQSILRGKIDHIILFFITFMYGCENYSNDNYGPTSFNDSIKAEQNISDHLNLIDSLAEECYQYYQKNNTDAPELELTGHISYEDSTFLIVSFDEVTKFGSWHYTDFSFIFLKKGDSLIEIKVETAYYTRVLSDYYTVNNAYPNRIDGNPDTLIDLTGDGFKDFVFISNGEVRDNSEQFCLIYIFNQPDYSICSTNQRFESVISRSVGGHRQKVSVIPNERGFHSLRVNTFDIRVVDNNGDTAVNELWSDDYHWNEKTRTFMSSKYYNKMTQ